MRRAYVVIVESARRTLVDRRTLAELTHRSAHTIRLRCPVARYLPDSKGRLRALYDMDHCEKILATIPARRRTAIDNP